MIFKTFKYGIGRSAKIAFQDLPTEFWVVTQPTFRSEQADCVMHLTMAQLFIQIQGGLKLDEVKGFFLLKKDAVTFYKTLTPPSEEEIIQDEITDRLHKIQNKHGKKGVKAVLRSAVLNFVHELAGTKNNEIAEKRISELSHAVRTPTNLHDNGR